MDLQANELATLQRARQECIRDAFYRLCEGMRKPDSKDDPSVIKTFTDEVTLVRQAYELAIIALGIPKDVRKVRRSPGSNRPAG